MSDMESTVEAPSTSLFQVYLRLRPPPSPLVQLTAQSIYPLLPPPERWLTVESPVQEAQDDMPTHITLNPPSESRKRATEKFAFTKVFEEEAEQIDLFRDAGVVPLVEGVIREGRDGLLATLGVTGSGKSHTILGSKSQRGLTQLSLDLLYRSINTQSLHPSDQPSLLASLAAADASEAQILSAAGFLDSVYGDGLQETARSRAATPMTVGTPSSSSLEVLSSGGLKSQWAILSIDGDSFVKDQSHPSARVAKPQPVPTTEHLFDNPFVSSRSFYPCNPKNQMVTRKQAKLRFGTHLQDHGFVPSVPKRKLPQRPSALPQFPDVSNLAVPVEPNSEYAVLVSMYEVYNDRIFDLLAVPSNQKDLRRRHLLFKSTEASPDRKVVAGLRKVVCATYEEALMVLETGLMERRVAGTGSNSVSSRSHGFFCVEVKRRPKGDMSVAWSGAQLTIVDLAGSERARNAKTAGATLAEAGKINESLMYLGQCLQMQSDNHDNTKPSMVPFRQCKLTELLFSNSFPSSITHHSTHAITHHKHPQKAIMIVTADPLGDFNATSQILRYSALAREVTVPRIPSVTSTIGNGPSVRLPSNQIGPTAGHTDEAVVEMAFSEIARLSEEVEILNVRLTEEEGRRREAEENWQNAEARAEEIEVQIRDECWREVEKWTENAQKRWKGAWDEEADRNDEHMDRKLEILSKGMQIYVDPADCATYTSNLENENESLRSRIGALERERLGRSPTKLRKQSKVPSLNSAEVNKAPSSINISDSLESRLSNLQNVTLTGPADVKSPAKTPGRKMKKLTARKWDLMDENDLDAFDTYC